MARESCSTCCCFALAAAAAASSYALSIETKSIIARSSSGKAFGYSSLMRSLNVATWLGIGSGLGSGLRSGLELGLGLGSVVEWKGLG